MENERIPVNVPLMAELAARGEQPEYLFWVGCAGAFDDRYRKVTQAFAKILTHCSVSYAVLGPEETCTGDPARRAGNEMLFQMQAMMNINTFSTYNIQRIITICPHCFNTFKNEYPDLGGKYEVVHHTQFLRELISKGILKVDPSVFSDKRIVFHDPCYLGRGNGEYEAPRDVLARIAPALAEMPRNKSKALCCGAGGAQMFKEAEKGNKEVYMERTEEALDTGADIIATACPFCMTMLTDGLKYSNRQEDVKNYDIAELVAETLGL
jgi:Fe-S oxidoreductase